MLGVRCDVSGERWEVRGVRTKHRAVTHLLVSMDLRYAGEGREQEQGHQDISHFLCRQLSGCN